MMSRPSWELPTVPMSALKNTEAVPASRVRSLASVAPPPAVCELIVAARVKVMLPPWASVLSVSMRTSVLSRTAPLSRTELPVVWIARSPANIPPLKIMPVPRISLAPVPILMSPVVLTLVTGALPAPSAVSTVPKVTPPSASTTVNAPSVSVLPMSPLKERLPVPASRVKLFDSPVVLSIRLRKVMSPAPAPVSIEVTSSRNALPAVNVALASARVILTVAAASSFWKVMSPAVPAKSVAVMVSVLIRLPPALSVPAKRTSPSAPATPSVELIVSVWVAVLSLEKMVSLKSATPPSVVNVVLPVRTEESAAKRTANPLPVSEVLTVAVFPAPLSPMVMVPASAVTRSSPSRVVVPIWPES